jgi:hypothetical protein
MEEGIPTRLTSSEGRRFAFPLGGAFLLLGGVFWYREHLSIAVGMSCFALALVVAGLIAPKHLGPIRWAWTRFAWLLSRVTNPVAMGAVYFLLFTPFGLVMRLARRNPLVHQTNGNGYWTDRTTAMNKTSDLKHQF